MRQTASADEAKRVMDLIGNPKEVAEDLSRFREAAQALSSDQPRFIAEYPSKWVAVHDDEVIAADSLKELLDEIDARGIDRGKVIVRFIEEAEKTLIL